MSKDMHESICLESKVNDTFAEISNLLNCASKILKASIIKAANLIINALQNGNKILICGNGGSASEATHFAAELINKYKNHRKALPCIALTSDLSVITSIANDMDYTLIFARQIEALANSGDILITLSTSGNSCNIVNAIKTAHLKGIRVIFMTKSAISDASKILNEDDILIGIESTETARIQEFHLIILHILCDIIDCQLK